MTNFHSVDKERTLSNFFKISTSALVMLMPLSGAIAADASYPVPQANVESFPVYDDASFDWTGFYAGVVGGYQSGAQGDQFGGGIVAGANLQKDFYLFGAEASILGLTGDGDDSAYGQVIGKGGLVLTDQAVVYAAAGFGTDFAATTNTNFLVGGGAEYAVSDDISLKAQYLYGVPLTNTSTQVNQITAGVNFHF